MTGQGARIYTMLILATSFVLGASAWDHYLVGRPGRSVFPEQQPGYEESAVRVHAPLFVNVRATVTYELDEDTGDTKQRVSVGLGRTPPDQVVCINQDPCPRRPQGDTYPVVVELSGSAVLESTIDFYGGAVSSVGASSGSAQSPTLVALPGDGAEPVRQLLVLDVDALADVSGASEEVAGAAIELIGYTREPFIIRSNARRTFSTPQLYLHRCENGLAGTSAQAGRRDLSEEEWLVALNAYCSDVSGRESDSIQVSAVERSEGNFVEVDYAQPEPDQPSFYDIGYTRLEWTNGLGGSFSSPFDVHATYVNIDEDALSQRATFVAGTLAGIAAGLLTTALDRAIAHHQETAAHHQERGNEKQHTRRRNSSKLLRRWARRKRR